MATAQQVMTTLEEAVSRLAPGVAPGPRVIAGYWLALRLGRFAHRWIVPQGAASAPAPAG